MIVCHKHRYIFLKTSKTAGTSVEIALSRFCSEGDIVTPISPEDEKLRAREGGFPSQRYPAGLSEYNLVDWGRRLFKGKEKLRYYNHTPARKLKKRLPEEVWNSYYKIAIVRNPWDRVISQYFWRCRKMQEGERPSMDEFLESSDVRSLMRKGYHLYTIRDTLQADKLLRYESLSEDLAEVSEHLSLPGALALPHAKGGHRTDKRHYSDILNDRQRDRIQEIFRKEIELTGYEF